MHQPRSAQELALVLFATIASIYVAYRAGVVADIEDVELSARDFVVEFTVHLTVTIADFHIPFKCNGTVDIIRLLLLTIRL